MPDPLRVALPLPPNANHYKAITCRGGKPVIYLTPDAKAYKSTAGALVRSQGFLVPLDGPVAVDATVFAPDRRGDLDGFEKVFLDVLQGVCYHNDRQVVDKHTRMRYDRDDPRIEFSVAPATDYIPPRKKSRVRPPPIPTPRPAAADVRRSPLRDDAGEQVSGRGPTVVQRARDLYRSIKRG